MKTQMPPKPRIRWTSLSVQVSEETWDDENITALKPIGIIFYEEMTKTYRWRASVLTKASSDGIIRLNGTAPTMEAASRDLLKAIYGDDYNED